MVGDRVVYANGYGTADTESGAPLSSSMIFRLGSTTKMMTSLAILALADRGRLDIDRPIGMYAPDIRAPRLRQVTMRQLLTHTAGILDYTSMSGPHGDAVHNAFVPTLADTIFFTAPGDVVSYSNLGYTIAGYVASVLTHKPYADVMAELLFATLGMTHSTLRPIEAMTFPMAQGHTPQPGGSLRCCARWGMTCATGRRVRCSPACTISLAGSSRCSTRGGWTGDRPFRQV